MVEKTNSELVFFRFNTPAAGIWKIVVEPVRLIDGQFHMWLPVTEFLDGEVYFLESDPYYTLTNPANAPSPIIVSYYDGKNGGLAQASGRGYTRTQFQNPSITAPGINVKGALPGRTLYRSFRFLLPQPSLPELLHLCWNGNWNRKILPVLMSFRSKVC